MGFFKKIFKPVSKVLDKIIPNEIKPALPYLAAFAPVFGPTAGMFGSTMGKRMLLSSGANILGQLSQEGNEGDINLLSAGLGALTGAMTVPGVEGGKAIGVDKFGNEIISRGAPSSAEIFRGGAQKIGEDTLRGKGLEVLAKGSDILRPGGGLPDLFSKEGLKAATLPATTATGDVMQAEARRLEKQSIIDAALDEAAALGDTAASALAIRNAMEAYGFFSEDEILSTIESAGYKAGGRVGFRFGGIDEAIESVQEDTIAEGEKGIMMAAKEDPLLVEEYNKYVFDLMEQRPDAKPMSFSDFKRMIMSGMKDGGIMATEIPLKDSVKNINKKGQPDTTMVKMKEGGLMNLGGKEMDLRGGGFVPIGKKEKADDVPARLSKNEFVMTADAVRAAGGGSVNQGAKRMYDVMNKLEARA
jgi:hypothetical protein